MRIPFLSTADKEIISSSQHLLPIVEISDGIVLYKNGGASLILESTSLNFGLLSEKEQKAVIASYAGLLNSFNFPVQIVIKNQKKDISSYIDYLNEKQGKIQNPKLLKIMENYKNFIQEAIKKKNVLSKRFFIVIPFTPYELGIAKSLLSNLQLPKKEFILPYPKSYILRKAKITLFPKRDHLIRQAKRLSIKLKQLDDKELIDLFYYTFNPESPVKEQESFI